MQPSWRRCVREPGRTWGSIDAISDGQAATLLNVSEKSVERAKAVKREAIPEVVRDVEHGELSVSRAAVIAKADPARQRRIVAGDERVAQLVPNPRRPGNAVGPEPDATAIRIKYFEPDEPARHTPGK